MEILSFFLDKIILPLLAKILVDILSKYISKKKNSEIKGVVDKGEEIPALETSDPVRLEDPLKDW